MGKGMDVGKHNREDQGPEERFVSQAVRVGGLENSCTTCNGHTSVPEEGRRSQKTPGTLLPSG